MNILILIIIKNLNRNKIKIDDKWYKSILIYYIGCVMVKDLWLIKINSVNLLYLIIHKINGYIGENNGNKYLTLVRTDGSINTLKTYEKLWIKTRDLIRSKTNNSDDYDQKYMKIRFNSNDDLSLKKTLELPNIILVVKAVFHEDNKYYLLVFLHECW